MSWFDEDLPANRPRRTVAINGRPEARVSPSLRVVQVQRRRPPRRPVERIGARPDRIAMWALMMALALIAVAALSAHP